MAKHLAYRMLLHMYTSCRALPAMVAMAKAFSPPKLQIMISIDVVSVPVSFALAAFVMFFFVLGSR